MKFPDIFSKIPFAKKMYDIFFQQKKKVAALENYDYVKAMDAEEKQILGTIKFCLKGSFAKEEDSNWIDYKLNRFQINYLDYAHKTKWVKSQFTRQPEPVFKKKRESALQTTFDFVPDRNTRINVPLEILAQQQAASLQARV